MAGDKLNRVKAIRKWLDKAEQSYSRDKEISGEINLIMAQAEMQRLKENYPHKRVKKWSIRVGAFALAIGIMFGINTVLTFRQSPGPVILPPKNENTAEQEIVAKETGEVNALREISKEDIVQENKKTDTPVIVNTEKTDTPVIVNTAKETIIQNVPSDPAPPVMSQQEIQSVVGKAGRTLRGQS